MSVQIAFFEKGNLAVSTVAVKDTPSNYETAITHPDYQEGRIIVVQTYSTLRQAEAGHKKWVEKMTNDPPEVLRDKGNDLFSLLTDKKEGHGYWRNIPRRKERVDL